MRYITQVGNPNFRPEWSNKTVGDACDSANRMKEFDSPSIDSLYPRCETMIFCGLVTEVDGRFMPGAPTEARIRLAVSRLQEMEAQMGEEDLRQQQAFTEFVHDPSTPDGIYTLEFGGHHECT